MNHLVAPSFLSADFSRLQQEVEMVNNSSADWFHLDVMDGSFVPNISFGIPVIAAIKKYAVKPLDVHLMVREPDHLLAAFRKAGADHLTIHYEACSDLRRTTQDIKSLGAKAGVAVNPLTPVSVLHNIITEIDLVCLMSVNPGYGGQPFIESSLEKISSLKELILRRNATALIEVDGGVTLENSPAILRAGADVLVAGNTVFAAPDPAGVIARLKAVTV